MDTRAVWHIPIIHLHQYPHHLLLWYSASVIFGMHGMVWYGVVWYSVVYYGIVWYGIVWYGIVWYDVVW